MGTNVPLEELDDETPHRSSAGDEPLQDLCTIVRTVDGFLDGVELSANPSDAVEESLFVFGEVGHVARYTIGGMVSERR
jgi:hypothetical protein